MASLPGLITFNLLTRSIVPIRQVVTISVSTYHLLSVPSRRWLYSENTSQRSPFSFPFENMGRKRPYSSSSSHDSTDFSSLFHAGAFTTKRILPGLFYEFTIFMPEDETCDQACLRCQVTILPKVDSVLLYTGFDQEGEHIVINVPGLEKTESDEGLCVSLNMPGVEKKDVCARVKDEYLLIKGDTRDKTYAVVMDLPPNFNKNSDWIGEVKDGMLKLTLPKVETLRAKSVANFFGSNIKRILGSCKLFDPSYRHRGYVMEVKGRSFTMYKKETDKSLYLKASVPGVEKMELTTEGLCISLNMPGLKIEDVRLYFKNDAFYIDGRRHTERYIAAICIPKGITKQTDMIKREMHDGIYKATLSRMTKVEEEMEKKKANGEFYIY